MSGLVEALSPRTGEVTRKSVEEWVDYFLECALREALELYMPGAEDYYRRAVEFSLFILNERLPRFDEWWSWVLDARRQIERARRGTEVTRAQ